MTEVFKASRRDFLRGAGALLATTAIPAAASTGAENKEVKKMDSRDKIIGELEQNELLRKVFVKVQKNKENQFGLVLKLNIDSLREGAINLKDIRDAVFYLQKMLPIYNYSLTYESEEAEAILAAALGMQVINRAKITSAKKLLGELIFGAATGYFIGRGAGDILQPKLRKLLQKKIHFKHEASFGFALIGAIANLKLGETKRLAVIVA